MKKTLLTMVFLAFMVAGPAHAQTNELPEAGTTPGDFFYFAERFFEGFGNLLAFGNEAKAERYLTLAEERLAEARALAEEGDERAQDAVTRYEEHLEKAKERTDRTGDEDLEIRVADATTKHLDALDEVLERVPEEAREAIHAAKERSMNGQIEALRAIAERDPEAAADIATRAADGRLRAAEAQIERGDDDEEANGTRGALNEYSLYAEFGEEISRMARERGRDATTTEEIVERATERHLEVLERVRGQVPEEARESIDRAMERSSRQGAQQVERAQSERSVADEARERREAAEARGVRGMEETEEDDATSTSTEARPDNAQGARDMDDDGDGIPTEAEERRNSGASAATNTPASN